MLSRGALVGLFCISSAALAALLVLGGVDINALAWTYQVYGLAVMVGSLSLGLVVGRSQGARDLASLLATKTLISVARHSHASDADFARALDVALDELGKSSRDMGSAVDVATYAVDLWRQGKALPCARVRMDTLEQLASWARNAERRMHV